MNNNHRRTIFISTPHSDFRQQILSTINVMVNNTSDIQSDTFDDQKEIIKPMCKDFRSKLEKITITRQ